MELPNIVHPTTFNINGYSIQVVTYMPITDAQARALATHCFRSRKWTKKDLKKSFRFVWAGDQAALAMLG